MMKKNAILMFLVLLLLASCSTSKKGTQNTLNGEHFMAEGMYSEALNYFENSIRNADIKGRLVSGDIYRKAGESAYMLENKSKALSYFENAEKFKSVSANMLTMQADCYKEIDNLSKEITVLENYVATYPSGKDIKNIKSRLFETCLESENWKQAEELWTSFGTKAEEDSKLMDVYLKVNIALKNEDKVDVLASKLLKLDPNNMAAMEQLGQKYFWKAENRYQIETKAYEKKKTRSQYAKLIKALDVVTVDFKTSLRYYKKLYAIQPDKNYARYLGNIYARLDDKEKSTYYRNRAR